ncbi:MAG: CidA/LrgA family protein [Cyanobacteria bacterium P01_H01_bin.130]
MNFLSGLTILLTYEIMGEVTVRFFRLPVPGPVVGMVLLLLSLIAYGRVPRVLDEVTRGLLSQLSLLFVPAGVGVMVHFQRIGDEWVAIAGALVGSTFLSLIVTALTMQWVQRHLQIQSRAPGR